RSACRRSPLLLEAMRPQPSGDCVGLLETESPDRAPGRAAFGQRRGDVEVHVRDGLVGGHSVVLPDRNSRGVVSASDESNGTGHAGHEGRGLGSFKIQDRFAVGDRNDQEVAPAALLTRYKGGGEFVPLENREGATARGGM